MPDAVADTRLGTGKILLIIFGVFAVPVGPFAVLLYGLARYLKKTMKIKWTESRPQFVKDCRYKEGVRYIGNLSITRTNIIPADDLAKSEYRRQGIIIMIAAGASLLMGILSLFI